MLKEISGTKGEFAVYEGSQLALLLKDPIGGNSLTVGIFCIQHGDPRGSQQTLQYYKLAENIINFPIVNDTKSLGLLKKFRSEIKTYKKNSNFDNATGQEIRGLVDQQMNLKYFELDKKLFEENSEKIKL